MNEVKNQKQKNFRIKVITSGRTGHKLVIIEDERDRNRVDIYSLRYFEAIVKRINSCC